jgi:peptide chain release factor 1
MKELHLTKKDFRVDWFSGTGGGGQYRNKHQNCCRITHIETGLSATGQSHRERPANQKEAFNRLVSKILAYYDDPTPERRQATALIRTYNEKYNHATDEVLEKPLKATLDGDIDEFIENGLLEKRPYKQSGRG